ncbi:MAG: DUF488 domain-containing protein [Candidatus Margulisiibacteriota bacterium]
MKLLTIGSSKKSAEEFFSLLKNANVELLLDIRLNNNSQLLGFSKGRDLKYFCETCHNIKYEHLPKLAPTKELIKKYRKDKDWHAYEQQFMNLLKSRPIKDIFKKACKNSKSTCLLCSESKPQKCHRRLVAEYLKETIKDLEITHL